MAEKIPFFSFTHQNAGIKKDILQAVEQVFDSEWYVLGESVREFEWEYAAFNQINNCVGVANGLDALQIALKTLAVQPQDEVIVPTNTFIASWLAISSLDAIPVPVEPDLQTYNLDPGRLEAAITARTKAIMPVHLYGQAC
jgi:dTDP-4-amino-4,6-dideoxygalactose transaminase